MGKLNSLKELPVSEQPLGIILGGYVNGLGIARGLGEAGISSIIVDYRRNLASQSKYVLEGMICPHPSENTEAFIAFMVELGSNLSTKGVLFCTNDIWLIPISQFQSQLEPFYAYPMSNWEIIERCIDKAALYLLAKDAGIPCPSTFLLQGAFELADYKTRLTYPCVIKPTITVGFKESLDVSGRTIVVSNQEELLGWGQRIIESGLASTPLLLQSLIPGDTENLYTLTAYSNRDGEILAYSTGHKIRQSPPEAGTIVSGRICPEPEVFRLGQKLIRAIGFYGLSNTEFKRDARDGEFKLIEINPRPGMWNYATTAMGINLPNMAYREVLGETIEKTGTNDTELVWLLTLKDLLNATRGSCNKKYNRHTTSCLQWLKSIQGRKVDGIFHLQDLRPCFYYGMLFLKSVVRSRLSAGL